MTPNHTPDPRIVDILEAAEAVAVERAALAAARAAEDAARAVEQAAQVAYVEAHNASIAAVREACTSVDWADANTTTTTQRALTAFHARRKASDAAAAAQAAVDQAQQRFSAALERQQAAISMVELALAALKVFLAEPETDPSSLVDELMDSLKAKNWVEVSGQVPPRVEQTAGVYVNRLQVPALDRDQAIGAQVRAELATAPARVPVLPEPDLTGLRSRALAMMKVLIKADAPVAVATIMRETGLSSAEVSRAGYDLRQAGKAQKLGPGFWAHAKYTGPKFDDNHDQHWAKRTAKAEV